MAGKRRPQSRGCGQKNQYASFKKAKEALYRAKERGEEMIDLLPYTPMR